MAMDCMGDVLDAWVFASRADVRDVSALRCHAYHIERSHERLGNVPPLTFFPRPTNTTPSNFKLCA